MDNEKDMFVEGDFNDEGSEDNDQDKLTGIITKVLFKSESNDFHVLKVSDNEENESEDPNEHTVVIQQPNLYEGMSMEFRGEWIIHSKFGQQLSANEAVQVKPINKEALQKYLSSDMFPGIGNILSKRIVDHFGDDVIDIFHNDIDRVKEVPMISDGKLEYIKEKWNENKEFNYIMLFLKEYNINHIFAKRIYDAYGKSSVSQIKKDPYGLFRNIKGIGFKYADKLALDLGFSHDHQIRMIAAVEYCLSEYEMKGHCYLLRGQLVNSIKKLLELDDSYQERIDETIKELQEESSIATIKSFDDDKLRYYSFKIYDDELFCYNKIKELNSNVNHKINDLNDKIEKIEETRGIDLTEEQRGAIIQSLSNNISIITGGPGCGKTTTCDVLIDVIQKQTGKEILVLAPTGRAAKKIEELNQEVEGSTIHKALQYTGDGSGFRKNEDNPLEHDVVLVDESSMIDIHLASSLLRALKKDAQIIFVGDKDQLPPVGPGNFFKDMIMSEKIKTFYLDKIFRQSKTSDIIVHAHEINKGKLPQMRSLIEEPDLIDNNKTDSIFIDSSSQIFIDKEEYPKNTSMSYGKTAIDVAKKLYKDTLPNVDDIDEVQILCPMNVGKIGNNVINKEIRDSVNPESKNKKEIEVKNSVNTFREGDKVIQRVNNYELGVFNGDIGKIEKIFPQEKLIMIRYPEKTVEYQVSDLVDVGLAYSISIHKSQGSEFECVIIMVLSDHSNMLSRNLYYTALTRAKGLAILVGERGALERAAQNNDNNKRQTSLSDMLQDRIEFHPENEEVIE